MNRSDEITIFTSLRCAGVNGPEQGMRSGSTYYPAVRNPDGTIAVSARCVLSAYINRKGRTDSDGEPVKGRRDVVQLTGWNTRSSKDGKGLADSLAKYMSEGKEFTCRAHLQTYDSPVKNVDGSVVMKSDGSGPLTIRRTGYVIEPGSLMYGDDAQKVIDRETAAFDGSVGFHARPVGWDHKDPNHQDRLYWEQIAAWRKAQSFQGGKTYGYAKVGASAQAAAPAGINPAGLKAAAEGTPALKFPGQENAGAAPQKLVFPNTPAAEAGADDDPF